MLSGSAALTVTVLGVAVVTYLIKRIWSPLGRMPGPLASLFTSAVLKWHELHGGRTAYVHGLHVAYGPVVRLGPNEVALASVEAVREVYYGSGGSGYDKTEFYRLFRVYGRDTMFTMLHRKDHAGRKRVVADRYANTNIMRPASLDGIEERAKTFVDRCSECPGSSVDLFIYLHSYAFDCITHHLFDPYGSNALRKAEDEAVMKQVTLDDSLQNRLVAYYSPRLHRAISSMLAVVASGRETPLADGLVYEASGKTDPSAFTLLSGLQEKQARQQARQQGMDRLDMAAECHDHMTAGIDTTGDALCFLIWHMSQDAGTRVQRRLQAELRSNRGLGLEKLAYLDAVVMEGLRCFPPIPMSLPRYVPGPEGRTIDGFYLPAGTIVSCQAYSTHRLDQTLFPAPDLFRPERWLEQDGLEQDRRRLFFAFGGGARGCVGKHLALAEMKVLLRELYSTFSTVPDESMTADEMRMSDHLISTQPRGRRCLMRLVPLDG